MGRRWIAEGLYYRMVMPFPIKYNYISEKLPKEKNKYNRNRKIECLCFILQYESVEKYKKKQFKSISISEGNFYIPQISANCRVVSTETISYDYKWYALNEEKYPIWKQTIGQLLEPYYSLTIDELQKIIDERIKIIKIKKNSKGFVFKKKRINSYYRLVRLKSDDTFLGGIKIIGFIVTYYFMIPLVFLSIFCLLVFIIKQDKDGLTALVGATAFLVITVLLFLLQVVLSYNTLFKESAFEKEYKKMFNIND